MNKLFHGEDVVELYDNEKHTGRSFIILGTICEDAMVRVDGNVLSFSVYDGHCREHPELSIKHPRTPDLGLIEGLVRNAYANANNAKLSDKDYRDVVTDILAKILSEFEF